MRKPCISDFDLQLAAIIGLKSLVVMVPGAGLALWVGADNTQVTDFPKRYFTTKRVCGVSVVHVSYAALTIWPGP